MRYSIDRSKAAVRCSKTWLITGLASILTCLLICGGNAQGQTPVPTNAFNVAQVYYSDNGSSPYASNTGQLIIDTANLGFSSGYINVENQNGDWVLQNMPIMSGMPYLVSNFNLGTSDGVPVSATSLTVDYSPAPLTTSAFNPLSPINIGSVDVDFGQGEGVPALPAPLAIVDLFAAAAGANRTTVQLGHPNVQTADNQCGPAALGQRADLAGGQSGICRFRTTTILVVGIRAPILSRCRT